MKHQLPVLLLIFAIALTLWQCVQCDSPTGGDKDTTPPVFLQAFPPPGATNFSGKHIRPSFDEFVVTKDLRKQLITSPSMNMFPITSPTSASRKLDISLLDTLKPNTTYVFNFGNSIQDYNEGSPYIDFKYVFSTGATIDSPWYEGDVTDALIPEADLSVTLMLCPYNERYKDSLVYKHKPTYVTTALDSPHSFVFESLKEGKHKLIALKDKGGDYLLNPKDDKVAFLSEPITVKDLRGKPQGSYPKLRLSKEGLPYKAHRPTQAAANRTSSGFDGGTKGVMITPISLTIPDFRYTVAKDARKGTLYFWYRPNQKDSLVFMMAYQQRVDTFRLKPKESKDVKSDSLQIESVFSGDLLMYKDFAFRSNIPLTKIDPAKIKMLQGKDSLAKAVLFKAVSDSTQLQYMLLSDEKNDEQYCIKALPHAMTDYLGAASDTLNIKLSTKKAEDLSISKLHLKVEEGKLPFPTLLQLTNEKATEVLQGLYIEKPQVEYVFASVNPAGLRLRLIEGRNGSRRWDTGNFLQQQQPERVWYFLPIVELRANWEVEETW